MVFVFCSRWVLHLGSCRWRIIGRGRKGPQSATLKASDGIAKRSSPPFHPSFLGEPPSLVESWPVRVGSRPELGDRLYSNRGFWHCLPEKGEITGEQSIRSLQQLPARLPLPSEAGKLGGNKDLLRVAAERTTMIPDIEARKKVFLHAIDYQRASQDKIRIYFRQIARDCQQIFLMFYSV